MLSLGCHHVTFRVGNYLLLSEVNTKQDLSANKKHNLSRQSALEIQVNPRKLIRIRYIECYIGKLVLRPSQKGIFLPQNKHQKSQGNPRQHVLFNAYLQSYQPRHSDLISHDAVEVTRTTASSSNQPRTHSTRDSTRSSPRTRSSSTGWPD